MFITFLNILLVDLAITLGVLIALSPGKLQPVLAVNGESREGSVSEKALFSFQR